MASASTSTSTSASALASTTSQFRIPISHQWLLLFLLLKSFDCYSFYILPCTPERQTSKQSVQIPPPLLTFNEESKLGFSCLCASITRLSFDYHSELYWIRYICPSHLGRTKTKKHIWPSILIPKTWSMLENVKYNERRLIQRPTSLGPKMVKGIAIFC